MDEDGYAVARSVLSGRGLKRFLTAQVDIQAGSPAQS